MPAPHSIESFRVPPGKQVRPKQHNPGLGQTAEMKELGKDVVKKRAKALLEKNLEELAKVQERLWANDRYAVLLVLQAMDSAGKDGIIKHVMSGVNPQGCQVFSVKTPSPEELDHTFLWRYMKCLPERGRIGIFNRSYYEDVLVVKVHSDRLIPQKLPPGMPNKAFWEARYEDISGLERHLVRNGMIILKFFLNVSREERKRRFLERLDNPEKHWKFSASDLAERPLWDQYMKAYQDALSATSTDWALWYIVPADHKWVTRTVVADILTTSISGLDLRHPEVTEAQRKALKKARKQLEND